MGLGVGILLIAAGAILAFAVHTTNPSGVDLHTVGLILLGVGVFSIVLSMVFWSSWAGPGGLNRRRAVADGADATGTTINKF
ncbi:MAG TPA: DUF6458 family protein [Candidatus Angelobacter sp.]|jgi:hypothetical protein|nr:DUF6458 family protein [Candidatus Angelobacter sp.]